MWPFVQVYEFDADVFPFYLTNLHEGDWLLFSFRSEKSGSWLPDL
jgi:hypothetical protein